MNSEQYPWMSAFTQLAQDLQGLSERHKQDMTEMMLKEVERAMVTPAKADSEFRHVDKTQSAVGLQYYAEGWDGSLTGYTVPQLHSGASPSIAVVEGWLGFKKWANTPRNRELGLYVEEAAEVKTPSQLDPYLERKAKQDELLRKKREGVVEEEDIGVWVQSTMRCANGDVYTSPAPPTVDGVTWTPIKALDPIGRFAEGRRGITSLGSQGLEDRLGHPGIWYWRQEMGHLFLPIEEAGRDTYAMEIERKAWVGTRRITHRLTTADIAAAYDDSRFPRHRPIGPLKPEKE